MKRRLRFTLDYAPEVYEHLDAIESKYHRFIAETIREQLVYTPEGRTKNRKPLEEPTAFGATWELRCGPKNSIRVFYEIDNSKRVVTILAIGVKEGNRLWVGRQEWRL